MEIETFVYHVRSPQTHERQIGPVSNNTEPVSGFRRKTAGSALPPQTRQISAVKPHRSQY